MHCLLLCSGLFLVRPGGLCVCCVASAVDETDLIHACQLRRVAGGFPRSATDINLIFSLRRRTGVLFLCCLELSFQGCCLHHAHDQTKLWLAVLLGVQSVVAGVSCVWCWLMMQILIFATLEVINDEISTKISEANTNAAASLPAG